MSEEKMETMNGDTAAWDKLARMMENKEVFTVQILETVKAGVVTYVEGIRAFIPASQLSDAYVEDTSAWIDKDVDVRIITPRIPDKWYVHCITKSFYKDLMDLGIRISTRDPCSASSPQLY